MQFIKKVRFLYKKLEISFFDEEINIIMQPTASLLHCNEGHAMPKKPLFLRYYGHIFIGLLPA